MRFEYTRLKSVKEKQKGMVLLLVLTIFAFAAIVSGELSYQSHREIRRTSNMIAIDEAYLFAKGGETFAIQKLLSDYINDKRKGLNADYLTEPWSVQNEPYELDASAIDGNQNGSGNLLNNNLIKSDPLQDIGEMSIVIEDLQARFNVNNVQYNNKQGSIKGVDQFENLINAVIKKGVQLPSDSLDLELDYQDDYGQTFQSEIPPADLARAVEDWIDTDDEAQLPSGSEDSFYSSRKTPYRTASQDITDVSELKAVTGFSENDYELYNLLMPKRFSQIASTEGENADDEAEEEQLYDQFGNPKITLIPAAEKQWGGVQNYLSALPFPSKINVNTAPAEVLEALFTAEQASAIVQYRQNSPYRNVEDIFLNLQNIKKQDDKNRYLPYLSVNSNFFLSTVTARIGETNFVLRSTLYRDENGNVRVLKRAFGR